MLFPLQTVMEHINRLGYLAHIYKALSTDGHSITLIDMEILNA